MPLFANMSPEQRKMLLFGAPVVGVIAVGSLLAKRGQSTTAPPATVSVGPAGSGGGDPGTSAAIAGLQTSFLGAFDALGNTLTGALTGVQNTLQQLENNPSPVPSPGPTQTPIPSPVYVPPPAPSSPPSPTYTAPQYSSQQVRDIFSRYGFSTDARIQSATFSSSTETAAQRIDRIVRDLNSGTRSIDQVTLSISQLPGSPSAGQT